MKNLREIPIVREVNKFTGRLEGDDTGYRDVVLSPCDDEDPDPVVVTSLATKPINFVGQTPGICQMYPGGISGAPRLMIVRKPAERALRAADKIVARYGKRIVVIDAFRDCVTQALLWGIDRLEAIRLLGLNANSLSILDEIRVGRKADDNTSFSGVVRDERFEEAVTKLLESRTDEIESATITLSAEMGKSVMAREVAEEVIVYWSNLGKSWLPLDNKATTAHGNCGATDLWLENQSDGRYLNFGAPYSYVVLPGMRVSPTVLNYFEIVTLEEYQEAVACDPALQWYLKYHGVTKVTQEVFNEARANRRLLYHALTAVGATYFSLAASLGEFWHFNFGNERGGKQAKVSGLEGSGNGCHAVLRGKPMAAWTNEVGHRLARQLLRR